MIRFIHSCRQLALVSGSLLIFLPLSVAPAFAADGATGVASDVDSGRSLALTDQSQTGTGPIKRVSAQSVLEQIDRELKARVAFAEQRPDSWLHQERIANVYLARARLSGNFNDYVSAQAALQKAFALIDGGGGPVLSRATLNYTLHRLPDAEADLAIAESAILINKSTRAFINGMRADVAFYRAQYATAKQAYNELDKSDPSVSSASRLAHYYAHTGDFKIAEQWFAQAEQRISGQSPHLRAWVKLQLGILDLERGRLDEALVHYQNGLHLFPGYWLVEEHIAEIDALQGRTQLAEKKYRNLINRTGSPMFMIALADVLQQRVNSKTPPADTSVIPDRTALETEAGVWMEKAIETFAAMMEQIPEAISGHALEFFLHTGDPARTLQMAQDNYRLRPGGQPALLLAQAQITLGQLPQAAKLIERLLASPYRSADLHATAAVVLRAQGITHKADQQEVLARAINPVAVDEIDWLRSRLTAASGE